MAESGDNGRVDLSGSWQGQYNYPRHRDPVDFVAVLTESDSWLTGVIHEVGEMGAVKGIEIEATVQGRRSGHSVTFLKIYSGAEKFYDTVGYSGMVNEDGTEISGRWTISTRWSGTFMMIRPRKVEAGRELEVSEQV